MKDALIVVLLCTVAFLLFDLKRTPGGFDSESSSGDAQAISPSVIQVIIESIQKKEPRLQPLETVFIKESRDNAGLRTYDARIMFLDTVGFFGVQYDVKAIVTDGGSVTILAQNGAAGIDREGPFRSYMPDRYTDFGTVSNSLDGQMQSMLAESRK